MALDFRVSLLMQTEIPVLVPVPVLPNWEYIYSHVGFIEHKSMSVRKFACTKTNAIADVDIYTIIIIYVILLWEKIFIYANERKL